MKRHFPSKPNPKQLPLIPTEPILEKPDSTKRLQNLFNVLKGNKNATH